MSKEAASPRRRRRWHQRARHALAHSLRVRLVALFVLLALAMAATFVLGMQYALSIGWRDAARPLLVDYVDRLAAEIGSPPSIERAQALTQRLPVSVRISGPLVNWQSEPDAPANPARGIGNARRRGESWRSDPRWNSEEPRLLERSTADGHRIEFSLSVPAWHQRPRFIGWATLMGLLLLTALAYARVRRMLRPLDDIRAGALRFGAGDFATAIPVRHAQRPDELGELAATINTMGADIHHMLEAKRALLLAISHELRSPLTRARLNTELLPESPEVLPSRAALLRDLALMRDLVTDLLESERLASPHAALQREPTDLALLADEVVASLPGSPTITRTLAPDLPRALLDPARLRLLLRNLLDNAQRHSADVNRPPELTVRPGDNGMLVIAVRDFGAGVPPDQLPHLGQPFYRPDAARTREGGGVGLGLYLCKLVAQAHGGTLTVRNAEPGLLVTVSLPMTAT
ncbi:MAG: ATP-binding protein [Rhodoferax sp.]|uniref:ATP-binding protein n=1 Tax=Rhodoferax sp. TaxID=50421 RepID=UPI002616597D|nr:ATP-binding protein [Rhodoferax sp.]MDD5335160.1 ATP-binding protein [Rhodoferax sp.]